MKKNLHIKNKNCKIHTIRTRKTKLQQKLTKTKNQRKRYKCPRRERFILCYKCATMKERKWCAIVGESHNKCEKESEDDAKK